jgi:hypothetical protein
MQFRQAPQNLRSWIYEHDVLYFANLLHQRRKGYSAVSWDSYRAIGCELEFFGDELFTVVWGITERGSDDAME